MHKTLLEVGDYVASLAANLELYDFIFLVPCMAGALMMIVALLTETTQPQAGCVPRLPPQETALDATSIFVSAEGVFWHDRDELRDIPSEWT